MENWDSWRGKLWAAVPLAWRAHLQNNFIQRCVMGTLLTVLSAYIIWGAQNLFPLYVWLFILLAVREWQRMTEPDHWRTNVHYLYSVVLLLAIVQALFGTDAALAVLAVLPFLLWLIGARISLRHPIWFACSILYLGLAALSVIHMMQAYTIGPAIITYFFGVVWATDTVAYVIGRRMGGALMAPDVSPKKTWWGFVGGLVAGVVVGAILGMILDTGNFLCTLTMSLVLSIAAQMSDLSQSAMKRYFSIKDTGGMIPGHGGVLDRIDSIMLSAPLYILIQLCAGRPLPW